ncbi:MAG: MBL fold metallo-hydrolase, partial [Deltaproteobacteria bacterium]
MVEHRDQRWRVGDVTVTVVMETTDRMGGEFVRRNVIPDATRERLAALPWLAPDWLDAAGDPYLVTQAFVLQSGGVTIVVDTCLGDDKERRNPAFHALKTGFLERLAAAGVAPEAVDVVLCTHLHFDHVGWNTRWDGARWVPTFPRARYLFARVEWEHWGAHGGLDYVLNDSVRPVFAAGLADLVETDHVVTPEVALVPTPGHTPGHVSVRIRSRGEEALVTGDMIHHPCQVGHPEWTGPADSDRALAHATRAAALEDAAARDVLVLGTHFAA